MRPRHLLSHRPAVGDVANRADGRYRALVPRSLVPGALCRGGGGTGSGLGEAVHPESRRHCMGFTDNGSGSVNILWTPYWRPVWPTLLGYDDPT